MKIAVVKLGALGDVLRTTCILDPLQRKNRDNEVWWYTSKSAVPLLENNPFINYVFDVDQGKLFESAPAFDLVISLDEELKAAQVATGFIKRDLVGVYINPEGKVVYTPDSAPWFDMGLLNRDPDGGLTKANGLKKANKRTYQEIILSILGFSKDEMLEGRMLLYPDKAEEAWARKFASDKKIKGKKVIGLNTGSGTRWVSKQMSIDKTVELINEMQSKIDAHFLLLGGPDEVERNKTILSRTKNLIDTGTDNSLIRFISIVNLCDTLITSDSLALHIGAALRKKVIAFFGPTSSAEIPLYSNGLHWLPEKECACFYASKCHEKVFCLDTLELKKVIPILSKI